jgi:GT2 family glycosyltransferase
MKATEVFGACAAACLIRRDVFELAGRFDESFFAVYEDVDLSYRVQLLGYRCRYVPDAVVHHAGSATLGRVSAQSILWGQRNLEWMYLKDTPALLLFATLPGHLLYDAAAALYFLRIGQLQVFLSAKWSALAGVPRVWRQRREVQRKRRSTIVRLWKLMDGRWLARKLREKKFDQNLAAVALPERSDTPPKSERRFDSR